VPHTKVSVTIPDEVLQTARRRSGDGGLSAYVAGAVELANRLAAGREAVADYEREHGAFTEEELEAVDRKYFQ